MYAMALEEVLPDDHPLSPSRCDRTATATSTETFRQTFRLKGELMKKSSGNVFNGWKRRWFSIIGNTLIWTRDEDSLKPLGVLKLASVDVLTLNKNQIVMKTKSKMWHLKVCNKPRSEINPATTQQSLTDTLVHPAQGACLRSKPYTQPDPDLNQWYDVLGRVIKYLKSRDPAVVEALKTGPIGMNGVDWDALQPTSTSRRQPSLSSSVAPPPPPGPPPGNLSPSRVSDSVNSCPPPPLSCTEEHSAIHLESGPLSPQLEAVDKLSGDSEQNEYKERFWSGEMFQKYKYRRAQPRYIRVSPKEDIIMWSVGPKSAPRGWLDLASVFCLMSSCKGSSSPFCITLLSKNKNLSLECTEGLEQHRTWLHYLDSTIRALRKKNGQDCLYTSPKAADAAATYLTDMKHLHRFQRQLSSQERQKHFFDQSPINSSKASVKIGRRIVVYQEDTRISEGSETSEVTSPRAA